MPGRVRAPFDEEKVQLVREFLRREFRECYHRDFFAFDQTAQVFLIETGRGLRHMLVIPRGTFEKADLFQLCDTHLAEIIESTRDGHVLLTPHGPVLQPQ
jgi:hypothetical protein